jgi:DNA polymerase elongation subunit (family B)
MRINYSLKLREITNIFKFKENKMKKITTEVVNTFLNGYDPMEHIITIEGDYQEDKVSIIYVNEKGEKRVRLDDLKPFVWAKNSAAVRLFDGDRKKLISRMRYYGIAVKQLITASEDTNVTNERLESGYKYMFYATRKMSYSMFLRFFQEGGVPIHERKKKGEDGLNNSSREYMSVTPVEQYMISTGKRLFKGYESYNDLKRFIFDLETQGLNPRIHRIEQIGVHTNQGLDKVISIEGNTKEELDRNEINAIEEFLAILADEKPDTVVGHNSENFDWDFLIVRCEMLGYNFSELSLKYFKHPIYKKAKDAVLKLGGEIEYYRPTVMWGHNVLDSLHASRRAQAIDSNMKSSNLKYITQYLNMKKNNRVYVQGDKITTTWNDKEENYGFCDKDGDWYKLSDKKPLLDGYERVSGRYIVERYLLDDLWETDKVEDRLNESNFLVGKMLPTTFSRACTMGTAGIWKLIMLAWCYENNLAIPSFSPNFRFTGGLSRLLKTGYVDRIVKLDYNSLYPSVILTWHVDTPIDVMKVMLSFLEYILTQREKYKELKAEAGHKAESLENSLKTCLPTEKEKIEGEIKYWKGEKSGNDKKQLPLKILANSFFGGYGSPNVFPFGDVLAAEKTTCISRMALRLMISHFKSIGYTPIVGDSFTADTPLFVKYDDGFMDIVPVNELVGNTEVDVLGREYDVSEKPYKILCRSGWVRPSYIYRHKTDKPLYDVVDGARSRVMVTEDHSLFNSKQEKIKPSEINEDTKLEYYDSEIKGDKENKWVNETRAKRFAKWLKEGTIDRVPKPFLNTSNGVVIKAFLDGLDGFDFVNASKTCQAGIMYLIKKLDNGKK